MSRNSGDGFDFIDSETTFMTQLCKHIFSINNTMHYSDSFSIVNCQKWLSETLEHCSSKLLDNRDSSISLYFLYNFFNLHSYFGMYSDSGSVSNKKPSKWNRQIEPTHMTNSDCKQFFIEVAQDYIYIVPKYILYSEEVFYITSGLKSILGLLFIFAMYRISKNIFAPKENNWYICEQTEQKLLGKIFFEKKQVALLNQVVKRSIFEYQHLKNCKYRPIGARIDQPILMFKLKKHDIVNSMCIFVESQPVSENYRNGCECKGMVTSRMYAQHKINKFLQNAGRFRVVLDYQIESSSDEEDNCHQTDFKRTNSRMNLRSTSVGRTASDQVFHHQTIDYKIPPNEGRKNPIEFNVVNVHDLETVYEKENSSGDRESSLHLSLSQSTLSSVKTRKVKHRRSCAKCFCNMLRKKRYVPRNNIAKKSNPNLTIEKKAPSKNRLSKIRSESHLPPKVCEMRTGPQSILPSCKSNLRTVVNRKPIWAVLSGNGTVESTNSERSSVSQLRQRKFFG